MTQVQFLHMNHCGIGNGVWLKLLQCKKIPPYSWACFVAWITTTPQPFYGPFSRTTRVSRCQKRTSDFMVQGKINRGRDTPTIWLGATPSGLTSAHLCHPPIFYRPDALPVAQPTVSKHWRQSSLPARIRGVNNIKTWLYMVNIHVICWILKLYFAHLRPFWSHIFNVVFFHWAWNNMSLV